MKNIKVLCFVFVCVSLSFYNLSQAVKTGKFYRFQYQRLPYIISKHTTGSAVKCCDTCLAHEDCQSVNYNTVTGSCQLVPQPGLGVCPLPLSDSSWNVYSTNEFSEWFLVFVGLAGNGVDVHASYVDGTGTVTDDVNCMTLNMAACQQNYRSPVMDSWSSLQITEVKYSLYKNGREKAYAIFNGTGSDLTNWFSQARLLDTSWTEALTTTTFQYVSIPGHAPTRRFSMIVSYGGCPLDLFFTVTITGPTFACNYDNPATFPQFLYSTSTTPSYFETGVNTDSADYITIHIR